MKGLRVALVAAEFPSEWSSGGGLGTYLGRLVRVLRDAGHEPEVFVSSREAPEVIAWQGVRVERVHRMDAGLPGRAALRLCRSLGLRRLQPGLLIAGNAWRLAAALARRDARTPFDLVQSSDYLATGLFVPRRPGRPHLVRCSSAIELLAAAEGDDSPRRRWEARLQRACIRRADAAYAPSRFVADHFRERHGLAVGVLRPPLLREVEPAPELPPGVPKRYLLHFGRLSAVKGSEVLARALPRAWRSEPELRLVLAGSDPQRRLAGWRALWGRDRERVAWLGELERPELYAVLRGAEAAVLPSLVDNLPNTAIESLMLGVPVVASAGASLDELVEPGRSGLLVPPGDEEALAEALVRVWRGEGVARGFRFDSAIAEAMRPERALDGLLRLAGRLPDQA